MSDNSNPGDPYNPYATVIETNLPLELESLRADFEILKGQKEQADRDVEGMKINAEKFAEQVRFHQSDLRTLAELIRQKAIEGEIDEEWYNETFVDEANGETRGEWLKKTRITMRIEYSGSFEVSGQEDDLSDVIGQVENHLGDIGGLFNSDVEVEDEDYSVYES